MTALKIFFDNQPNSPIFDSENLPEAERISQISDKLEEVGVRFEQWQTIENLTSGVSQEEILKAYQREVKRLMDEEGYLTVDVVSLTADHPQKAELRQKFLNEHTHSEDEVRFFVDGKGLFSLHLDNQVFEVLCTRGDLISVPGNTRHWFDMGENPHFTAIRFFNNPEGWVANFTGSEIAQNFSRLES